MAILLPQRTVSVEDFIASADTINFTYETLCLINVMKADNINLPVFNVLDDYIDEIKEYAAMCELDKSRYDKYYQAPKILCYDLYKNSELDFLIMRINGITDPTDFTMKKLLLIPQSSMPIILSQIYNANKKFINEYNSRNEE